MSEVKKQDEGASQNTDREIWREREGDAYSDSIHVTAQGAIGINCGGFVYVKPAHKWHELAALSHPAPDVPGAEEVEAIRARHEALEALGHLAHHDWASEAHADRATLLRLLDAARDELREVAEAAGPFLVWADIDDGRHGDQDVESLIPARDYRRLAAALKEKP